MSRASEIREDLWRWRSRFVLVTLWRAWRLSGRPWWRRLFSVLRDWPHTVMCPACDGRGGDMSVGGCEWCAGECTWDLREDMVDEAWAMIGRKAPA